mgnify:CR=1 FL=1
MYYFNSSLFEKLPALLGITINVASQAIYGNDYIYSRRVANQSNISFEEVVKTCNVFRMSISRFITTNPEEGFVANRFKYVIPEDKFKPIIFHPENIRWVYGPNGLGDGINKETFAKDIGVSLTTVTRWINPNIGGISVHKLIDICNKYRIDLDVFVTDENEPTPKYTSAINTEGFTPRLWEEMNDLKQALCDYKEEAYRLSQENRKLKISLRCDHQLSESDPPQYIRSNSPVREWIANWELLNSLHTVLGISKQTLINIAGLKNFNSSYADGNLLINSLVRICNHFQISTHHFFLRNPGTPIDIHPYSFYKAENWKMIHFYPERINNIFGPESLTGMTRGSVEKKCELKEWEIRSWRKENSLMRIKDMIHVCNVLNITPSCFIIDRNETELEYPLTQTEVLLEENSLLRSKIIELNNKIKNMKTDPLLKK